jgi:hypothetical protein
MAIEKMIAHRRPALRLINLIKRIRARRSDQGEMLTGARRPRHNPTEPRSHALR